MRASRTWIILEADTVDEVESNRVLCVIVSINNLLAGYASSACMKLLNRGTWEIPVASFKNLRGSYMQSTASNNEGNWEVRCIRSTEEVR